MADIELVIKMPEEQYNMILLSDKTAMSECVSKEAMMYAIKNGTQLPEGHGRIIDESKVTSVYYHEEGGEPGSIAFRRIVIDGTNAPTIIEADNESEDEE